MNEQFIEKYINTLPVEVCSGLRIKNKKYNNNNNNNNKCGILVGGVGIMVQYKYGGVWERRLLKME